MAIYIASAYLIGSYMQMAKKWKKIALACFTGAMVFLVGVDRVYLGVHSYSQVLLGWGFAAFALSLLVFFEKEINTAIDEALQATGTLHKSLHLGLLVTFIGSVLIYSSRKPNWSDDWSERFEDNCGESLDEDDPMLHGLIGTQRFALAPSLLLGARICSKKIGCAWTGGPSIPKRILRAFTTLLICALLFVGLHVVVKVIELPFVACLTAMV
jgi:hypothetical protein